MTRENKDIKKLLDFIHSAVTSDGGDGGATWVSTYDTLDEILPIVQKLNAVEGYDWEVTMFNGDIMWGKDQEWVYITKEIRMVSSGDFYIEW